MHLHAQSPRFSSPAFPAATTSLQAGAHVSVRVHMYARVCAYAHCVHVSVHARAPMRLNVCAHVHVSACVWVHVCLHPLSQPPECSSSTLRELPDQVPMDHSATWWNTGSGPSRPVLREGEGQHLVLPPGLVTSRESPKEGLRPGDGAAWVGV